MESFWNTLPNPFFVLAPMADVTDPAYRKIIAARATPDVMWTEFVSADGIYHTREKKGMPDEENPLVRDLQFADGQHPIVAQLFSSNPDMMEYAATFCASLGFDGIDINMGCPDRSIEKQSCGAAMIRNPEKAVAVIEAAKKSGLPVSVKTRIGYSRETIDEWLGLLLAQNLDALTVHLRTRSEMSNVPAHWDLMPRIVALRNAIQPNILLIGNGDVESVTKARELTQQYGCDGVMLGRAIFGNPWLFVPTHNNEPEYVPTAVERLDALAELVVEFDQLKPKKSFHILKKHIKAFVVGFDTASEVRASLNDAVDSSELLVRIALAKSMR
jgi:nifR3 family TIM-barrel protein